jgi:hypothetical protein
LLDLRNFGFLKTGATMQASFNDDVDGPAHCGSILASVGQLLVRFHERHDQVERCMGRRARLFAVERL